MIPVENKGWRRVINGSWGEEGRIRRRTRQVEKKVEKVNEGRGASMGCWRGERKRNKGGERQDELGIEEVRRERQRDR